MRQDDIGLHLYNRIRVTVTLASKYFLDYVNNVINAKFIIGTCYLKICKGYTYMQKHKINFNLDFV